MAKIFELAGELILGTRLRKLADKFLDEVSMVYKLAGVEFETSWFALFFLLDKKQKVTISELAYDLGVSQSAVSQIVSNLEKRDLVKLESLKTDKRLRFVSLTDEGRELVYRVKPIWHFIRIRMRELLNKGKHSRYMLEALSELEKTFESSSLATLVMEDLSAQALRVETFSECRCDIERLKQMLFRWVQMHGAPSIEFINDAEKIIKNNRTLVALRADEPVAMVIVRMHKNRTAAFLMKNPTENGTVESILLEAFLKTAENREKMSIYVPCSFRDEILFREGFVRSRRESFSDELAPLCVYER